MRENFSDTLQKSLFYLILEIIEKVWGGPFRTLPEDEMSVFRGGFGGSRFAHGHARGPILVFCGGAPGYSKFDRKN